MGGSIELISAPNEGSIFIAKLKLPPVEIDPDLTDENIVTTWQLKDIEDNDIQALGEYVHALKGVTGNFKLSTLPCQLDEAEDGEKALQK
jgi:hypothetical protein